MNFRSAFLAALLVIALSAAAAITAEEEMPQANAHLATARSVKVRQGGGAGHLLYFLIMLPNKCMII